jgi:hypothetical protein
MHFESPSGVLGSYRNGSFCFTLVVVVAASRETPATSRTPMLG